MCTDTRTRFLRQCSSPECEYKQNHAGPAATATRAAARAYAECPVADTQTHPQHRFMHVSTVLLLHTPNTHKAHMLYASRVSNLFEESTEPTTRLAQKSQTLKLLQNYKTGSL
jgi:hypothetical protein